MRPRQGSLASTVDRLSWWHDSWKICTHRRSQQLRVLPVVCHDDPRLRSLGEHFLSQLTRSPTLDSIELIVDPAGQRRYKRSDLLVGTIDCHIEVGVLVDISED